MNILVKKDNKTFGPYTRDEILEFIQVDELSQDDLGTWEGEESWLPLVSLLASPQEPKIDSSVYDQFVDDEVDHEKMKEWEDVFQDEEENDSKITDSSADNIEESNVIPPVAPLPEIRLPHEPNTLPVDNPPQVPQPVEDTQTENIIGNTEEYAPPPPSLPLPPPPKAVMSIAEGIRASTYSMMKLRRLEGVRKSPSLRSRCSARGVKFGTNSR